MLNNLLINANAARVGFDTSSGASLAACTLVSTDTFFAVVKKVTNKDLATIRKNWIDKAGVARFSCRWEHNRTRNMLTLSIQQNDEVNLFLGPLKIGVQGTARDEAWHCWRGARYLGRPAATNSRTRARPTCIPFHPCGSRAPLVAPSKGRSCRAPRNRAPVSPAHSPALPTHGRH